MGEIITSVITLILTALIFLFIIKKIKGIFT